MGVRRLFKKKKPCKHFYLQGFDGGLYWTRTNDPRDVNTVLYQLSQQTKIYEPIFVYDLHVTSMEHSASDGRRIQTACFLPT